MKSVGGGGTGYWELSGSEIQNSSAADDVVVKLGDAAGVNKLSVKDSGDVEQATINSDGIINVPRDTSPVPAIKFGSLNTGITVQSGGFDTLYILLQGGSRFIVGSLGAYNPSGTGGFPNNAVTSTSPSVCPRATTDDNTGLGWNDPDEMSVISGGVEQLRVFSAEVRHMVPSDDGGVGRKWYSASATLSGASTTINNNVPSGAKIIACLYIVETLITSGDGALTWDLAYNAGGASQSIATGLSFAKNTKGNKFFSTNINTDIASAEVDTVVTPNANTFSGGVVYTHVLAEVITDVNDYA